VVPCYNPAEGWSGIILKRIEELNDALPAYELEFIISNDGSTRISRLEIERLLSHPQVTFLDHRLNQGKGASIRKGAARSHGDFIVYTDIDFPFGIEPVVQMVQVFESNPRCQFVYGARNKQYFRQLPVKRRIISFCLKMLNLLILSPRIRDTQAGIKGLRRDSLTDIMETRTNSFVFEIELIRKLVRRKAEIHSVEVAAQPSITFSDFSSKVLWREVVSLTRILLGSRQEEPYFAGEDLLEDTVLEEELSSLPAATVI
jgi:cellulose synthase/poly-beta-1,6-N-acetylglucosamine synthase-like glycosyltransferase